MVPSVPVVTVLCRAITNAFHLFLIGYRSNPGRARFRPIIN